MRTQPDKQAGFTLLEVFVIVIAVIILLVIAYLRHG